MDEVSHELRLWPKKTASLIKEKKLMNVEHRTSNIEHRIMYSACRELFVERSISNRLSEAIPLGTPPFLKGAGGIFKILPVDFNEVSQERRRRPRASSLIVKETLKKRISNIEQGIINAEVRYSIDLSLIEIVRA